MERRDRVAAGPNASLIERGSTAEIEVIGALEASEMIVTIEVIENVATREAIVRKEIQKSVGIIIILQAATIGIVVVPQHHRDHKRSADGRGGEVRIKRDGRGVRNIWSPRMKDDDE